MGVTTAHAQVETFRAGEFTVTFGGSGNGLIYRGCDSQGKCINLNNGASWHDDGNRGITWLNGDYTYIVSWRDGSSEIIHLTVYKGEQQILRRQLEPIANDNLPVVPAKVVTWCNVVNIKSGQLALRFSPGGKSSAGLNNGNEVLLKKQQGIWAFVQVVKGSNSRINGLEGWVNANYLSCTDEPID